MAALRPHFPDHHQLVPKTLAGPFPLAGARRALSPVASAFAPLRGRDGFSMCRKGNLMLRSCSAVHLVDGSRVLDVAKDEKPIIVIDNYDSFTYNLCQYIGELGTNFEVYRNDDLSVDEIRRKKPRGILISPGPGAPTDSGISLQTVLELGPTEFSYTGAPTDSGISLQTVLELGPTVPLFGVCMGLQCIGEAFGGKIVRSPYGVVHGKGALVYYDEKLEDTLFSGLPNPFTAARYHSLVIENDSFPNDVLEITAWTEDGLIMAARHKVYTHIQGVQFHPESVITKEGKRMIHNFLMLINKFDAEQNQK